MVGLKRKCANTSAQTSSSFNNSTTLSPRVLNSTALSKSSNAPSSRANTYQAASTSSIWLTLRAFEQTTRSPKSDPKQASSSSHPPDAPGQCLVRKPTLLSVCPMRDHLLRAAPATVMISSLGFPTADTVASIMSRKLQTGSRARPDHHRQLSTVRWYKYPRLLDCTLGATFMVCTQ